MRLTAGTASASETGEVRDNRMRRGREDYGFETARDRKQRDVSGDQIADRIDKPNRVTVDRLQDPVQEEVDVIGRDGEYGGRREIRRRKQDGVAGRHRAREGSDDMGVRRLQGSDEAGDRRRCAERRRRDRRQRVRHAGNRQA